MNTYIDFERKAYFLTAVQLYSGKWAIATKDYDHPVYTENTNHPLFDTEEEAECYLKANYQEV